MFSNSPPPLTHIRTSPESRSTVLTGELVKEWLEPVALEGTSVSELAGGGNGERASRVGNAM